MSLSSHDFLSLKAETKAHYQRFRAKKAWKCALIGWKEFANIVAPAVQRMHSSKIVPWSSCGGVGWGRTGRITPSWDVTRRHNAPLDVYREVHWSPSCCCSRWSIHLRCSLTYTTNLESVVQQDWCLISIHGINVKEDGFFHKIYGWATDT